MQRYCGVECVHTRARPDVRALRRALEGYGSEANDKPFAGKLVREQLEEVAGEVIVVAMERVV